VSTISAKAIECQIILFLEFARVCIGSTLVYRLAHGDFLNDFAAFQQYTLTDARFTAKVSHENVY
jgi:hypothetical protein